MILVPVNLTLNTDGKHNSYISNKVLNQYEFSINVNLKSIGNILSIYIVHGVATSPPSEVSTAYPIRYAPGLFLRCFVVFIMTVLMGLVFTYPCTLGRLHWHRWKRSVSVNQPWTIRIKWMALNHCQQTVNGVHPMMSYCQFYPYLKQNEIHIYEKYALEILDQLLRPMRSHRKCI